VIVVQLCPISYYEKHLFCDTPTCEHRNGSAELGDERGAEMKDV
jgi:hypothetical protein